ncbi:MAG: hypothetical protein PHW65_03645 [Dehalococcoidales bacterium]|nr:hypothetical protein [Dehalococcoidales bacterium]
MAYRKISTETVRKNMRSWALTGSITVALRMSKDFGHSIFRLPNGMYAVRIPTGKRLTPEIRAKLKSAGQLDWR